jgi:hypothetical protein
MHASAGVLAGSRGWSDVSRMGAAWIVARSGHRVAGIDRDGILLISPNGARIRIYHVEPDEHAAVAWSIRAPCSPGCSDGNKEGDPKAAPKFDRLGSLYPTNGSR